MNDSSHHCLVIPDIHQNVRWIESILQKEGAAADRIVILGDYFDPKVESATDVSETCIYLSGLQKSNSAPITFLVGNHDLPYLYDLHHRRSPNTSDPNPYLNGAYNPYLSESIKQHLSPAFLDQLEPFAFAQGWILSHAGVHLRHLVTHDRAGLDALHSSLKAQVVNLPHRRTAELAAIGTARGGCDEHGGIVWQDWFKEFEDTLDWPQIVGHTIIPEPNQKGRSWDLDTKNGSYGILANGKLEIRCLPKE
ncbi:metallophosphoesterase [Pelagicoccus sp. SDUM812002]|uniref:metallophosphoesterase n=1 Tax=Pelagicoccus sp. SDUM812002 TaxID=3041266 RepID=UPI00280D37EB|nr:metallophosphoesterase [Pelagicoccus sp. SDUM812002]MDQ8188028.1 metallophosphoesterase [Pelagicoccus sp. SDUM812002]